MGQGQVALSPATLMSAVGDRWSAEEVGRAVDLLAKGGGRFPSGIRSLPAELVKEVQRERALAGMLNAVGELGYRGSTVQDALDRSGLSRPTFYEHFANKEDCFLIALDGGAGRLCERAQAAAGRGGDSWRDRLRAGLTEVLRFAAVEPDTARALIVETRAAGGEALLLRERLLNRFSDWIDSEARGESSNSPSPIAADGVVGGIEAVLFARINNGETELLGLLPSLMYFAVLPYAGQDTAAEELQGAALA